MQVNDALWLMLMAFVVGMLFFIIWFLSYSSLQQTYNVNGLNEANRLALYDSIDYASRGQRGVFYLDVNKYKDDLQRLPIRRFDHQALDPVRTDKGHNCTILVLPDEEETDNALIRASDAYSNNADGSKNSNFAHLGKQWELASLAPESTSPSGNNKDVAIRGILIATKFKDDSIGNGNYDSKLVAPTDINEIFGNSKEPSMYVSAELINTYGRPAEHVKYNPYDTDNDISR